MHPEQQYLDLMRRIWEQGSERIDRTGVGTRSVMGAMLRFDLADGAMPLVTTKRVYWKTATREMLWFLTGETNIRPLVLQGVKIWNDWPHARYVRETGDEIALDDFVERIAEDAALPHAGAISGRSMASNGSIGRLIAIATMGSIEKGPGSIRSLTGRFAARQSGQPAPYHRGLERRRARPDGAAALPQDLSVSRRGWRLNCVLYQRSCDVALGLPFNLWSAALLQRMLAQQVDLEPGELVWMGGDTHLYLNHTDLIDEQLAREPQGHPRLR